jgi:predicted RNase H-like nuclease (RuvC/YqgF family)
MVRRMFDTVEEERDKIQEENNGLHYEMEQLKSENHQLQENLTSAQMQNQVYIKRIKELEALSHAQDNLQVGSDVRLEKAEEKIAELEQLVERLSDIGGKYLNQADLLLMEKDNNPWKKRGRIEKDTLRRYRCNVDRQ